MGPKELEHNKVMAGPLRKHLRLLFVLVFNTKILEEKVGPYPVTRLYIYILVTMHEDTMLSKRARAQNAFRFEKL